MYPKSLQLSKDSSYFNLKMLGCIFIKILNFLIYSFVFYDQYMHEFMQCYISFMFGIEQ